MGRAFGWSVWERDITVREALGALPEDSTSRVSRELGTVGENRKQIQNTNSMASASGPVSGRDVAQEGVRESPQDVCMALMGLLGAGGPTECWEDLLSVAPIPEIWHQLRLSYTHL